ncbi:MAG: DinB family protein [Gemmatimonadota bacterium]|nr:DinB family protein [Gemmatimonadota bacterium]
MSVFSNLAAGAAEDAAAYIEAVLELLGDADPIPVLESTVDWCRERTQGLTREQLAEPEAEGKWSIAGILQHLADSELVWGYRLRTVLAEDRPRLTGYDQDRWASRLGYAAADRAGALLAFGALRAANLSLLSRASPTDLDRVGMHSEHGEESVRHMIRLYAGHDLVHRRQLQRLVERFDP